MAYPKFVTRGEAITSAWANDVVSSIRRRPSRRRRQAFMGSGGGDICPFGEITRWTEGEGEFAVTKTGIRGGVIYCGDQNWNMGNQELVLTTDGVWLVYIEISVVVNQDDDSEIILPGIKTGTQPTGDWGKVAWTEGTNYPSNTSPVAGTGAGTIIVPLGKLTIADESAKFENVGCGNITIDQCGGTLTHSRSSYEETPYL